MLKSQKYTLLRSDCTFHRWFLEKIMVFVFDFEFLKDKLIIVSIALAFFSLKFISHWMQKKSIDM
jgi:hypothetical protein